MHSGDSQYAEEHGWDKHQLFFVLYPADVRAVATVDTNDRLLLEILRAIHIREEREACRGGSVVHDLGYPPGSI